MPSLVDCTRRSQLSIFGMLSEHHVPRLFLLLGAFLVIEPHVAGRHVVLPPVAKLRRDRINPAFGALQFQVTPDRGFIVYQLGRFGAWVGSLSIRKFTAI